MSEEQVQSRQYTRVERPEDCGGKTIDQWCYEGESLGFRFTDGTYFFCRAEVEADDESVIYLHASPTCHEAHALGILNDESYARIKEEQFVARQAQKRAQFDRLRAELEGNSGG